MKDSREKQKNMKKNKTSIKLKIVLILIFILIIGIIVILFLYKENENVKYWIDKNILKKEVMQEQAIYIELENENSQAYAYSQYLGVLSNNKFDIYNSSGNKEETLSIEISNPIFNSDGRFLAVAEKDGQNLYLITNKTIEWKTKIEGNISQVHVNENGYVAVVITNTSYKTVVEMYSPEGEELFKTYLSSTRIADASISEDNKNLAIAEIDTSGTIIQSTVKIISIDKSQEDPDNSIENTFKSEGNRLITSVKYQEKNKLLCMYTDGITIINDGKEEVVNEFLDKKIMFSSINLSNSSVVLEEKSSGLFTADSVLKIINSENKIENEYVVEEVTKNIYTNEKKIALNLGTEIEFINTNGNLIKRYIANQEITNIVLSNELTGIVYRNKIEIVKL